MDTATVSVLVSGVVALAGVVSPFALRRREQAREDARRRDQRFGELRSVIDAACVALVYASERVPAHDETLREECARPLADRLDDAVHEVHVAGARMAAHLGADHEIIRRYDRIRRSAEGMVSALRRWSEGGRFDPDEIRDLQEAFERARDDFFDASARRLGPDRG